MLKHIQKLFVVFYFLILNQLLYSQEIHYQQFENIKPQNEAFAIDCFMQDAQGVIWFGTDKGLFNYNGYTVSPHFAIGEKNNTRIHCGIVTGDSLCLGGDNGLFFYNCRTGSYDDCLVEFPRDIRALGRQGDTLWIGSLGGLYRYFIKENRLETFSIELHTAIPHESIYSIVCNPLSGDIYIGTYNGLCKYVVTENKFHTILLPESHLRSKFVNSLLLDEADGSLWIGTDGALFRYSLTSHHIEHLDLFSENTIKALALDSKGNLLAGTDNGLYVYDKQRTVQHVVHDSRNQQSLSNNVIWSIFKGKEGNIWLGTDQGISLSRYNTNFSYVPIFQITGTGEGNQFYTLLKDSRSNYWMGGTNGLIRFRPEINKAENVSWYKMSDKAHLLAHNRIRYLYEDREKNLWITTDGSLHRYDYAKDCFVHYNITDSTQTYKANWAYQIFEDSIGKLWIAAYLGGVFVVDKNQLLHSASGNCKAEYNFSCNNGLSGMNVNQMIPDKTGNVWILLYSNVIDKINIHTREVSHITVKEKDINYLLCDHKGFIWGGYRGGVFKMNPESNQYETVSFGQFNNNEVLAMVEVEKSIWISTTDGIWVVDKESMSFQRMLLADGIFTSMYYLPSERRVYLGGIDGIVTTSPEASLYATDNRPIYLTNLFINNEQVSVINGKSISYTNHIELDYRQNNLSFEFSDLPYSQKNKSQFVYRLEGYDQEWNLLKPEMNRIIYSNLNYGNYQLVICKLSSKGEPSENCKKLDIRIRAPWYYTWWAQTIYYLLLVGMVTWMINYFRVKIRLKHEFEEKEKMLEQSRQKMEFFTNLSHDLKTPLSMIIAPISKLLPTMKNEEAQKLLKGVQRNAMKMNTLIHQVVDVNRIDSNSNAMLILSQVEFVTFVENLCSSFEEVARMKNLRLSFNTNCERIFGEIDVIKWESIVENLLSNACKYTDEGGNVELSLFYENNLLTITIKDTGIGIPEQDVPYVFQRFFQSSRTAGKKEGTGIGLYLVKMYVELHGGRINIHSIEEEGTTVCITLPLPENAMGDTPAVVSENKRMALGGKEIPPEEINKPCILIVDDNIEIAEFIAGSLQGTYRCKVAADGKQGLEICYGIIPDLIITDLMMPVMNGMEMIRAIRRHVPTSGIPIILLTAKNDKNTELDSVRHHVDAFIGKPFDLDLLLSRIEQLLSKKRILEAKKRIELISTPKEIEAVSYDEKFLADITVLIEKHVSDSDLNVNLLCTLSGVNNKQMYRKLKQLTGMTPVEYIKSIRMKKAAMLLKQRKFSVAEVMYMVGFSNHSYFSKCFQGIFGMTPRQFMDDDQK